jgi:NAD(P)-dependent dehydrogenase (short-subunit alcohol dehydrogenase family)
MSTIVITGGSSGLGQCIVDAGSQHTFIDWSLSTNVDVRDERSIERAADDLKHDKVDVLIQCAGINAIDYLLNVERAAWDNVMNTNARGLYMVAKELLPWLAPGGTILNIVSNASHVPMTASAAYNASKGAAEILTRQMARELKKTHDITVFGISPNKLAGTAMSNYIDKRVVELRGWTQEQAQAYQLAALPAGEETDPATLAEFILFLLSNKQRHKYLNGCIIPYGGP